jgi:hypothetical protein
MKINFGLGYLFSYVWDLISHDYIFIPLFFAVVQVVVKDADRLITVEVQFDLVLSKGLYVSAWCPVIIYCVECLLVESWNIEDRLGVFELYLQNFKSISHLHKYIPDVIMVVRTDSFFFHRFYKILQLALCWLLILLLGLVAFYKSSKLVLVLAET